MKLSYRDITQKADKKTIEEITFSTEPGLWRKATTSPFCWRRVDSWNFSFNFRKMSQKSDPTKIIYQDSLPSKNLSNFWGWSWNVTRTGHYKTTRKRKMDKQHMVGPCRSTHSGFLRLKTGSIQKHEYITPTHCEPAFWQPPKHMLRRDETIGPNWTTKKTKETTSNPILWTDWWWFSDNGIEEIPQVSR